MVRKQQRYKLFCDDTLVTHQTRRPLLVSRCIKEQIELVPRGTHQLVCGTAGNHIDAENRSVRIYCSCPAFGLLCPRITDERSIERPRTSGNRYLGANRNVNLTRLP